jgi:hypothetical protein
MQSQSAQLSKAPSHDLAADPLIKSMTNLEQTPRGRAQLHKQITAGLSKSVLSAIFEFRKYSPSGMTIFSDHFIAQNRSTLSSMALGSLYGLKPGPIKFTKDGEAAFGNLAASFAIKNSTKTQAKLQLLDDDSSADTSANNSANTEDEHTNTCRALKEQWQNDTGEPWRNKILTGQCNYICSVGAYFAGAFGDPGRTAFSNGDAAGSAATNAKFALDYKLNNCDDGKTDVLEGQWDLGQENNTDNTASNDASNDVFTTSDQPAPACINNQEIPDGSDACWGGLDESN